MKIFKYNKYNNYYNKYNSKIPKLKNKKMTLATLYQVRKKTIHDSRLDKSNSGSCVNSLFGGALFDYFLNLFK